jgi:hypothetical protein
LLLSLCLIRHGCVTIASLQARAALTAAQGEEAGAQGRLSEKEARQQELYRKQGGAKQYTSKAERDKALNKEVGRY